MTSLLGQASRGEPWSTRAAALAFAQYFWFRHCFLLRPRQSGALHDMVVSMLADKKLEVQELAAVSLSGGDAVPAGCKAPHLTTYTEGKTTAVIRGIMRDRLCMSWQQSPS